MSAPTHTGAPGEETAGPLPGPAHPGTPDHRHDHDHEHDHPHEHAPGHDHPHEHAPGHDHPHDHADDNDHPHEQAHGHDHAPGHDHAHDHDHPAGFLARLRHSVTPHSHDAADSLDSALESSARGIRAVKISLVGLGATAGLQLLIFAVSGSVALLADTIHNFSDALTAVPLWIAFVLGRRAANRGYTYGYGRAEDLAGLFVVAMIALSAVLAGYESITRLFAPAPVTNLGWVAVAGLVGFLGNEAVALFRIREGKAIGSAALVADGYHARTDGLTSLAVLVGAGGVGLGWTWADPVIGLVITVAILMVLRTAGRSVFARLMDGVDPDLTEQAEQALADTPGVAGTGDVRLRWIGHRLHAEAVLTLAPDLSLADATALADQARRSLHTALPRLGTATIATRHG